MRNDSTWIAGLMAENYEAIGFIPLPTIEHRYMARRRYILQEDERGNRVGYLLHGAMGTGQAVCVSQHCIQYEKRLHGYGEAAFSELLRRAQLAGASSIRLRCADDLPALQFWQALGFQVVRVVPGGEARQRVIVEMVYPLELPLFKAQSSASVPAVSTRQRSSPGGTGGRASGNDSSGKAE